jgi:hypothetical protein
MPEFSMITVKNLNGSFSMVKLMVEEKKAIEYLIETNSLEEVKKTFVNVNMESLLSQNSVKRYIKQRLEMEAAAAQITPSRVKSTAHLALSQVEDKLKKKEPMNRVDVSILGLAADIAGTKKSVIDLKVSQVPNPYREMSDEEFNAEIQKRLADGTINPRPVA